MKKSTLAIAVAVATFVASSANAGTDGWYAGVKAGMTHWSDNATHYKYGDTKELLTKDTEKNAFAPGVFGGYNFNDYLGVEFAYDYLGKYTINDYRTKKGNRKKGSVWSQGIELAGRFMLPFTEDFEAFAKLGLFGFDTNNNVSGHLVAVRPFIGGGLQYYFTDNVFARFEYEYFRKLIGAHDFGVHPDAHVFTIGLGYSFGSRNAPEVVAAPEPEKKTSVVTRVKTLDSDVTFGFDKSSLTAEGQAQLDSLTDEINNDEIKNEEVAVIGHTDRIGSAAYNQKLSEKRAQTVANYLNSKGVFVNSVEGKGKSEPLTGSECDGLSRTKLIKCLAKDRRVEVSIKGEIEEVVQE